MTMTSASPRAARTWTVGRAASIPSYRTSRTSGAWWRWTKYSWKSSQPSSVRTCVRTGSSVIGRIAARDAERRLQASTASVSVRPSPQPSRPRDVGREVAVAEPEPVVLAVALEHVHHGPRLAGDAPATLVVEAAGEHVHDRVVVGHHEQAVPLGVVAGVDDDRQVAGPRGPAAGRARASRRRSRRRGRRPSRSAAAPGPRPSARWSRRSYGAGIRTITVSKPSSRYGRSASATSGGRRAAPGPAPMCSMPLWSSSAPKRRLGGRPVVAQDDREADRLLDRRDVAPDVRAVRGEDLEPARGPRRPCRTCSRRRPAGPRSAASSSGRSRRPGSAGAAWTGRGSHSASWNV